MPAALGLLAGCGGGGGGSTGTLVNPQPVGITVTLAPAAALSLNPSATQVFTATIAGTTDTGLTWTVDGVVGGNASDGTLAGSGASRTYTAPAAGTHVVAATSVADATGVGATTVTVVPASGAPSVSLAPAGPVTLPSGGTQAFTATFTGTSSTSVLWAVDGIDGGNATVGSLTGAGTVVTYNAPAAAGTHYVTVTGSDSSVATSAQVVVQAPASLVLAPAGPVSLAIQGSQLFTATVSNAGSSAVTWAVDGVAGGNAAVGTLSGSGSSATYTAPASAGSHTVTATSVAAPAAAASAAVTVRPRLALAPAGPVTVQLAGTQAFTATVTGAASGAVTWTVDGITGGNATTGTIGTGTSATYTAPGAVGTHTVTATSTADPTVSATATVLVQGTVAVTLTPAGTASVSASGSLAFTAAVSGTSNTAVTWSVAGVVGGNASVGTISGSGTSAVYAAPAAAGSHLVTATSNADTGKSASTTVTVVAASGSAAVALACIGPATLVPSGATLCTATVTGAASSAVTWSVDGIAMGNATVGTIRNPLGGNTVLYTAPAATGAHTVTATSSADASAKATLAFTVAAQLVPLPGSVLNVQSSPYNAAGDGSTDDTAAIMKAVTAAIGTGRTVYLPAGTYRINPAANSNVGLRLGSNMTLYLDPAAVLKALPTSTAHYEMIRLASCQNVNICGGTILGNNGDNSIPTPTTIEDGNGIQILDSSNVVVEGLVVGDCFCDGIYVDSGSNITVCKVTAQANRRNGMSIVNGDGIAVIASGFNQSTGSVEVSGGSMINGSGMDLEPNNGDSISNVLIDGCTFDANLWVGLAWGIGANSVASSNTDTIFVVANTVSRNIDGVMAENCSGSAIMDNIVTSNSAYGIYVHDGAQNSVITGNTVTGTGLDGDGAGIECYKDSGAVVDSNSSTGNARYGVLSVNSSNGSITNNVLTGNGSVGLRITNPTNIASSGNTQ